MDVLYYAGLSASMGLASQQWDKAMYMTLQSMRSHFCVTEPARLPFLCLGQMWFLMASPQRRLPNCWS